MPRHGGLTKSSATVPAYTSAHLRWHYPVMCGLVDAGTSEDSTKVLGQFFCMPRQCAQSASVLTHTQLHHT